jgi:hypothetical protein
VKETGGGGTNARWEAKVSGRGDGERHRRVAKDSVVSGDDCTKGGPRLRRVARR